MVIAEDGAVVAEIDRFAFRAIEPRVARPEAPMAAAALRALLDEAEQLGLCGTDEVGDEAAPWADLEGAPATTLAILERLARANAATAFVIHQRALARAVLRRAEVRMDRTDSLAFAPDGRLGLGRVSVARLLAGAPLDDEDRCALADVYGQRAPRVLPVEPTARGLVTLGFDGSALRWQLHTRDALSWDVEPNAHGLDELETATTRPTGEPAANAPAPAGDVALALAAHQLALVTISLGAVERGHALARRYAADRRQGGAPIDRHPAVLELLGKARTVIDGARAQLAAYGGGPLHRADLGAIVAFRARAQPALAEAAHATMQIFGGIGYMRDTGLEKIARDVNALRALAGTPGELTLIAAEWERLHG